MRNLKDHPVGLLLWTGMLLGATFPLGKMAAAAGVPPLIWAMVVSGGASLVLLPLGLAKGVLAVPRGQALRYVVISGSVSFALINVMIFALVPLVGAGQVGMMFALSPVATLALSVLAGLRGPGRLGVAGITLGMFGALLVAWGRGGLGDAAMTWSLVALLIPVVLAIGNVYRTLDWPEGVHPLALAFWSHLAAILGLVAVQLATAGTLPLGGLVEVPGLAIVQAIAAGLTFPAYFRLQKVGGPVLLSQIGYVAAAVGLVSAVVFLDERYAALVWCGAAIIGAGIALTILAQTGRRPSFPAIFLGRRTRARLVVREAAREDGQRIYCLTCSRNTA